MSKNKLKLTVEKYSAEHLLICNLWTAECLLRRAEKEKAEKTLIESLTLMFNGFLSPVTELIAKQNGVEVSAVTTPMCIVACVQVALNCVNGCDDCLDE